MSKTSMLITKELSRDQLLAYLTGQQKPGRRIFDVFTNGFLLVSAIVITLFLLELGVRWLPPPYQNSTNPGLVCSDQLGWRGRPNYEANRVVDGHKYHIEFNKSGMHDTDHSPDNPQNTFRILMLGDSFVQAAQVDEAETSHQILENLLNSKRSSRKYEVISAGVSNWGTGQELIYYRDEGRFYQPDLVLLMVYIGNDFKDNLPGRALTIDGRNCYSPYFAVDDDQITASPIRYAPGLMPVKAEYSVIYRFLSDILGKVYQSSRLYAQLEPLLVAGQPRVDELDYYHLYLPQQDEAVFGYAWKLIIATIERLDQEVKNDGAKLEVVLISPREVVNFTHMTMAEREAIYQVVPDLRQAQEINRPNQKLIKALAEADIKVIDLLPPFVRYTQETGESLYFQADNHWNIIGNRVAAEAIYEETIR